MSELASPPPAPLVGSLRDALLDSRQRWRDLAMLSADFVFETDAWGRFVLVAPDPALGWSATGLIGHAAAEMLADGAVFNPFQATLPMRRERVWLKRGDGRLACLSLAVMPLHDPVGSITGVRGLGIDMTEADVQDTETAAALRRGLVLDRLLSLVGRETLAQRMMAAALHGLSDALGAEGASLVVTPPDGGPSRITHQVGSGGPQLEPTLARMATMAGASPIQANGADQRSVLMASCQSRMGEIGALAVWRAPGARPWDADDLHLVRSAANIIRMIMDHEAVQHEMRRQARTDPLTGLMNRRAFMEEFERRLDRLTREELPGTLLFADLDHFKPVNDTLGHEVGDKVLIRAAELLRATFRPTDLVARLGGDEFAVWMDGADHMTAAERAEALRELIPRELSETAGPEAPRMGMSIGIACRGPRGQEAGDSLIRRADMAMYEVKRHGRGHWRVSLEAPV